MATRWIIAQAESDSWRGRYGHWDGYPSGVGAQLWKSYHEEMEHNAERLLHFLTQEHVGWSYICGCDLTKPPHMHNIGKDDGAAQCYCHGDDGQPMKNAASEDVWTTREGDTLGCEYAYIIHPETRTLAIERILRNERTGKYEWSPLWAGSLEGEEPDWKELDNVPHTMRFFGA